MQDHHDIRQDMRATVEARRDLGPDYETALIESFVSRLDATITQRVRAEMHASRAAPPDRRPPRDSSPIAMMLASMGMGIPLTVITAEYGGGAGLLLSWGGIVTINVAYALGRLRHRD
ncbi:hypothetical protein FHS43_006767 [Streptosporangium becharense]|uniref:Integral membrane protein n=1 Tax=Streptosporangium becharense TaxID=1816182 RepID=A0A7W9MER9_9ACTN|nr:hypothetical protein [Streptosporangium becharense]MBB2915447.1 hypothetical protein [Streptosporangium becharense]MBB5817634.1 hypothetical protein [Streptosporangium becharense]